MIPHKKHNNRKMNREELERRIIDAADGELSASETESLELELEQYPELLQDYRDITGLANLSLTYGQNSDSFRNDIHIHKIRKLIDKEHSQFKSVEEITITWFKKYALAAAILIFSLTSLTHLFLPEFYGAQSELTLPELFYPYEESNAESYVIYLDELIDE